MLRLRFGGLRVCRWADTRGSEWFDTLGGLIVDDYSQQHVNARPDVLFLLVACEDAAVLLGDAEAHTRGIEWSNAFGGPKFGAHPLQQDIARSVMYRLWFMGSGLWDGGVFDFGRCECPARAHGRELSW